MNKKIYFLGLILTAVFSLLPLYNQNIIPTIFTDISYHLSVAQHFNQAGGVVAWDYWDNVPGGRAHLYPPVFHIILAALLRLGFAPIFIIKAVSLFVYFFLLFSAWFATARIFNEKIGLITVLLLAASFNFYAITAATAPASLSIALMLWVIYFYQQKKDFNCLALFILMLYLHRIIPGFFIGAFLIYGWFIKEFARTLKIVVLPLILFLPFLIFIICQQQYFFYFHTGDSNDSLMSNKELFNVLLFIFGFAALLFVLWQGRKKDYYQKLLPFCMVVILFLPVAVLRPGRFYNSVGYVFIAVILAVVIYELFKKLRLRPLLLILAVAVLSVQVNIIFGSQKFIYRVAPPFYIQNFLPEFGQSAKKDYSFFDAINLDFFQTIKDNSQVDDVLSSATSVFAGYYYDPENSFIIANLIQGFTGLATTNARKPEVLNPKLYQPLPPEKVKILIVDLRKTPEFSGQKTDEEYYSDVISKNFVRIAKVDLTYAFINKNRDTYKVKPAKPIVPFWLASIIIFVLVVLGFWGDSLLKFIRKKIKPQKT